MDEAEITVNERIKDLMGKTLDDKFSHTWDTMTHEGLLQFSEKFAELIVEEVYDYILNATFDDEPWPSRKEVKQHFGVEEK